MPAADQLKAVKAKFAKTDSSGDGKLDETEFAALLRKGNPRITAGEASVLFRNADKNRDGRLTFDEFADFVFGQAPEAPPAIKEVFEQFTGGTPEMDERKFEKLCRDCCLYNKTFTSGDTRLVFSKVKSGRTIGLNEFMKALKSIAEKRGCAIDEIYRALEMVGGPQDEPASPAAPSPSAVRASREGPRRSLSVAELATRKLLDVYMSYANRNGDMDVRAFCRCLQECAIVDPAFTAMDAESSFAQVCKRSDRKIVFGEFRSALELVAQRKDCEAAELESMIRG